jgi:methylated-DNA-[protein]-cysteine S-methyltransferase
MTDKHPTCVAIEPDLIAAAIGEAEAAARARVDAHVARCAPCREDLGQYRALDHEVGALRAAPGLDDAAERARVDLLARLADLRSRLVAYAVFPSPLGPVLIARSEHGVSLVQYVGARGVSASTLGRRYGIEAEEDGEALARLHRELLEYLDGRRTRLDWPLDLSLARSDFQRAVLRATAGVPHGAVTSYAAIAGEVGKPRAVRAVAQALRRNPLPIVVPCHRIVATDGDLTGYAGHRLGLKERLLAAEGVRTVHERRERRVARERMYHLDAREREYCLPTCGSIARLPIGRVTLFASRTQAEAVGLAPCATCRPDLHPLPR